MQRMILAASMAFQLGGMVTCSILGSLFLGLWLDRRLGTAPCITLILMVVGLTVAAVGAYRIAKSRPCE
jgi:F0F1-type ATP synthase assembly protein I